MSKTVLIACRIEPEVKQKFEDAAKADRRPPSQLLRILIEQYVEMKPERRRLAVAK